MHYCSQMMDGNQNWQERGLENEFKTEIIPTRITLITPQDSSQKPKFILNTNTNNITNTQIYQPERITIANICDSGSTIVSDMYGKVNSDINTVTRLFQARDSGEMGNLNTTKCYTISPNYTTSTTYEITNNVFLEPCVEDIKLNISQLDRTLTVVRTAPTANEVPINCRLAAFTNDSSNETEEPTASQREFIANLLKERGITKSMLLKILEEQENEQQVVISSSNMYQDSNLTTPPLTYKHCRRTSSDEEETPGTLARELLKQEAGNVAKLIKSYMADNNVLQRELVEETSLNQSHLSQHFNRGTPMKTSKRIKLYNWFERHQVRNQQEIVTPIACQTEKRRRVRWKWSPVAIQILNEAYKKNRFPTREQRLELSRICNRAEQHLTSEQNKLIADGEWERINEARIYSWFTNKRKLGTRQDTIDPQTVWTNHFETNDEPTKINGNEIPHNEKKVSKTSNYTLK